MHTAFQQDVGVVPQAYALHPADDPLITPHQNVCRDKYGLQMFSHMFVPEKVSTELAHFTRFKILLD